MFDFFVSTAGVETSASWLFWPTVSLTSWLSKCFWHNEACDSSLSHLLRVCVGVWWKQPWLRNLCKLELVFHFDISIGSNPPDACLCAVGRVTFTLRVFRPKKKKKKPSSLEKRFLTDSITKIKAVREHRQKGCFMQRRDWAKRSIKSEMCTYKLHFTHPPPTPFSPQSFSHMLPCSRRLWSHM